MKRRFSCFILIFSLFSVFAFSEGAISDFTEQKVAEFVTLRVALKSEDEAVALKKISEIRDEVLPQLQEQAKDFEQEECILESMYFMEMYDRLLSSSGTQKELRAKMKSQMQKNIKCIESRNKKSISEWLYLFTGDVTAYYMTRSVTATFLYGMKVKGFYERAVAANGDRAAAHVSLGNWCFYAPAIVGGGRNKSQKQFEAALKCAKIKGEQYMAFISFSQLNYEKKNFSIAKEYLEKAVQLELGSKELDRIKKCNEKGYSHFQYLRNRSGIDQEMAEDEKEDDDK